MRACVGGRCNIGNCKDGLVRVGRGSRSSDAVRKEWAGRSIKPAVIGTWGEGVLCSGGGYDDRWYEAAKRQKNECGVV